jgi:Asp-tRNA(Asn)/Glu-tRNA(Gln) amidotransferase A subunit family amidase
LGVAECEYQTLSVAFPSRLSSSKHPTRALNGWRIAVKDNFLLKGLRTSLCNKAYYELYPPTDKTAACIEHLIEAGAVIVGETKLSSMVSTEEPTQGIDFQTAWNPRADGYQSPAGSSSGSGAAIASYEWLDIAIGSDSTC